MSLYIFLHGLTGRIFKILPLKEGEESGETMYLDSYIKSLARDMKGALFTFDELESSSEYITTVNIVQWMATNDFSAAECKQEVFKALALLKSITEKFCGGA